jgi:hypothetical protein
MCERADTGDPFGYDDSVIRPLSLEARFHSTMFEEETRLIVDDAFADVEKRELSGFHDVGADGSEWKLLDIAGFDCREVCSAIRREMQFLTITTDPRLCAITQDEGIGLRVSFERDPVQIHDFALIPAEQRHDGRKARKRASGDRPDIEILLIRNRANIANFSFRSVGRPSIGELNAAARFVQHLCGRVELARF